MLSTKIAGVAVIVVLIASCGCTALHGGNSVAKVGRKGPSDPVVVTVTEPGNYVVAYETRPALGLQKAKDSAHRIPSGTMLTLYRDSSHRWVAAVDDEEFVVHGIPKDAKYVVWYHTPMETDAERFAEGAGEVLRAVGTVAAAGLIIAAIVGSEAVVSACEDGSSDNNLNISGLMGSTHHDRHHKRE